MIRPRRALTTLAVGFLVLDAVLFAYAALLTGRARFFVAGAVCAAAAALVLLAWRRYRRTLVELERARDEMRTEIASIRHLLQTHHLDN